MVLQCPIRHEERIIPTEMPEIEIPYPFFTMNKYITEIHKTNSTRFQLLRSKKIMAFILDGNSEHAEHA